VTTITVGTSPTGIAVTPDAAFVYVACQGVNAVSVIAAATNTVVATIPVGTTPVAIAISPNGAQAYVVNRGSTTVSVIDTTSRTVVGTITVGSRPVAVAFSPDGTRAYVPNLWSTNVSIIDTASKTVTGTFATTSGPNAVAVAPNGRVYVSNNVGVVTVHSPTGTLLSTISGFTSPDWVAVTPNGNRILVANANGGSVSIADTTSNTITSTLPTGTIPTALAITPDGTHAYVVNEYSLSMSVIDLGTNTVTKNMAFIGAYPIGVAIQPPVTGPPPCTFSLSATSASFTASGGPGSVTVTPSATCGSWTAVSNVPWITVTPPGGGTGAATVNYTVAGNPGTTTLTGTLTIAGQTYTVTETGIPCTFSLSANSATFTSSGGPGSVNVTAPTGCAWTAVSNSGWATINSGASGNGNGSVGYTVGSNSSSLPLNGSLTIAGQTFNLTESGVACTFSLSASSGSFASAGGPGGVNVTSPTGCAWTAVSNVGWVTVNSGASGSGNGSVGFTVGSNASSLTQNGTLTIAGLTYTVNETGVACTYSLSASSNSFPAAGGPGSVNVTAPAGCAWTAVSNVGWTTVNSGASGSGNGSVGYTVSSNNGTTSLSGTLTIAGLTYTVNESGVACSFSLSAPSASLGSGAGGGSVNLTTTTGCAWSATSDSGWLTLAVGSASGTGSATVSYSVTANPGIASRTGNLTIGGLNFAVTQTGASFTSIHINCGGPQFTDAGGTVWTADNAANYSVTNATIGNTTTPALYQTDAWSPTTLQYQFTVPNGSFTVQLKFAEFYLATAGQRVFNIVVNGTTFYANFDILAPTHAGAMNTAYDVSIPVVVNNGQVTIQLVPVTGSPKLNALAIF
jgi:YVTN family beta-propeller protein